ncbi:MAG TPA: hypothetical protein EYP68_08535 [Candidatus Korarchaeota archaeon]|nr:hypothetical protein [Candidatus Korarchaeota archaeon]
MKKAPFGISVINSLFLAISATLLATGLSGLLNLPDSPLNPFLRAFGVKLELPKPGAVGGAASIFASTLIFITALGLGRGKLWAYLNAIFLFVLSAIVGAHSAVSDSFLSILTVLISVSCLAYLIGSRSVKNFLKETEVPEEEITFELSY